MENTDDVRTRRDLLDALSRVSREHTVQEELEEPEELAAEEGMAPEDRRDLVGSLSDLAEADPSLERATESLTADELATLSLHSLREIAFAYQPAQASGSRTPPPSPARIDAARFLLNELRNRIAAGMDASEEIRTEESVRILEQFLKERDD